LDIVLAALDLGDDGLVVAGGEEFAQVHEGAVRGRDEAAVIFGVAAEPAHFGLQQRGRVCTILRKIAEKRFEARGLRIFSRIDKSLAAVERRLDQAVEHVNVMVIAGHLKSPEYEVLERSGGAKEARVAIK